MDITPTISIHSTTAVDNGVARQQNHTLNVADQSKTANQASEVSKVFTPAPPLRPNVQDYVDIDRTLLMLRQSL